MTSRRFATVGATIAISLMTIVAARADDEFAAARDLYASAAYDEALTALDRVKITGPAAAPAYLVRQYRALCLIALGRPDEAKKTIEDMVRADPIRRTATGELPPRLEAVFRDVRQRVLPVVAQEQYARGKTSFDGRDYAAAASTFERVVKLLEDPDVIVSPPLADLRTLASGFLQLSRTGLPAKAAPAPAPAPKEAPAATAAAAAASAAVVAADTAPVTLVQAFPAWPSAVLPPRVPVSGLIEVAIDETGKVASLKFVRRINPIYDQLVELSAKTWRYTPATHGGKPVASSKVIVVKVGKEGTSEAEQ